MKKSIIILSAVILLISGGCSKKELTFEEKLKLLGNTNDTSCYFIDDSIKTFDDYEQKQILARYENPAIVKVKCDEVNHYVYIHDGLIDCNTINTVTIIDILKIYGQNVYLEGQQIELTQQYGYMPGSDDASMGVFLKKEYGLEFEEACTKNGKSFLVNLNDEYNYNMISSFEDTVPLDKNEEYLMVLDSSISKKDNTTREYYIQLIVPYNTEKYQDLLANKYGFRFTAYTTNLMNELQKEFMK